MTEETKQTYTIDNGTVTIEGGTLTIVVDLTKTLGPSNSGKMETIASTGGFQKLGTSPRSKALSLNLYLGEK